MRLLTNATAYGKLRLSYDGGTGMEPEESTQNTKEQRQALLLLCRFLSLRLLHRIMLILLSATGILLSLIARPQFAPYGIAVICLILPPFISGSYTDSSKKESGNTPLSVLYDRYRYSPIALLSYRVSFLLCSLLLFLWYFLQNSGLLLCGIPLPLLYFAFNLAFYPIASRLLFRYFHHRLMNGSL